jgi:hypothetical protein
MENVMLAFIFIAAGFLVFRHVKNLLTDGQQKEGCQDCALNNLLNLKKEKKATSITSRKKHLS